MPVPRGSLVAAEQEVPVAEPSVAERAGYASILLAVPVTVIVVVVVAVAASSTPVAVLPTQPAMTIQPTCHPRKGSARTCIASC